MSVCDIENKATSLLPVGAGLALFICLLVGTAYTGAALNPVRAFGPAVIRGQFHRYHCVEITDI
jgi:aquaporin related protein